MNIVTMALSDKTSFDHVCYREWGYIGIVGIARNHRREKCNIIYCYLSSAEHYNKHSTDKGEAHSQFTSKYPKGFHLDI